MILTIDLKAMKAINFMISDLEGQGHILFPVVAYEVVGIRTKVCIICYSVRNNYS